MNATLRSPESPAERIRRKHAELLVTFRDLLADLARAPQGYDPEALRGLLAFLRQGVLAFAHGEERTLAGADEADCLALEHAFLEAEIERFNEEAQALLEDWTREVMTSDATVSSSSMDGGATAHAGSAIPATQTWGSRPAGAAPRPVGTSATRLDRQWSEALLGRLSELPADAPDDRQTGGMADRRNLRVLRSERRERDATGRESGRVPVPPGVPAVHPPRLASIQRRLHRIEAVLELHALRHDESDRPRAYDHLRPLAYSDQTSQNGLGSSVSGHRLTAERRR